MTSQKATRVLFVCTGNTCRSAMAKQMLERRLAGAGLSGRVEVESAGLAAFPGSGSPSEAIRVLKDYGVDGRNHRARLLTGELVDWADVVLVMAAEHETPLILKFPRAVGKMHLLKSYAGAPGTPDIPDPIAQPMKVYQDCARDVSEAVDRLIDKLKSSLNEGGTQS